MQSSKTVGVLFEAAPKSIMFIKVLIIFVPVIVVDCIMVPIYDTPAKPPCPKDQAVYQNGRGQNGYYGVVYPSGGYQVKDSSNVAYAAPVSSDSSAGESSEVNQEAHPQSYQYDTYY
ncbi:hypothetical protein QE152_g8878 [Popillia japonica]|uniref:Uncharacterized protein n=1 Tax=Popillia japonica TaxID=7064 RepID=A0AAW1M0L4_POPJA